MMEAIIKENSGCESFLVRPKIVLHLDSSIEEAEKYLATMQKDIFDLIDNFKEECEKRYLCCSEEDVRKFKQNATFSKDFLLSNLVFEKEIKEK